LLEALFACYEFYFVVVKVLKYYPLLLHAKSYVSLVVKVS
jgi:hypothetical protein